MNAKNHFTNSIKNNQVLVYEYGSVFYTCDKQVLWESAGAFFPRDNSDFTRQLARFTRSWSSGKMLGFQPRGFVFEPVGMR